ncbi:hypothetical protein [Falsirhodobacter halotolerans]|uniref:hypothetical protein n=1 Tax=Falsirhodobacter halotolerans TaxID=1146892 RepID=UPI001FD3A67D|nr:hypothetical protein [Falsirhodobacter halotolerans]MCJ8138630.1 hypothetical protein [Falsirhodobacter halotolerans]
MTPPIPHIERQQTGPLGDRHVTQYWLSDGTHLRSEARTPDTANLNVAWAYREAAERARRGGEVPQPLLPMTPVGFAHPRDVLLARIADALDGWPQFADLRRQALVELFGSIGPAAPACACNPPEGHTHQTWCPEGPGAMYP